MTANRLGLTNAEEAYIGCLLSATLNEAVGNSRDETLMQLLASD